MFKHIYHFIRTKVVAYNAFAAQFHPLVFRLIFLLSCGYFLFFYVFSRLKGLPLPGEFWVLIPILFLLWYRRTYPLLRCALLPTVTLISYRFASAIVGESSMVHIEEIIELEEQLFTMIPTLTLQSMLYVPDQFRLLDFIAAWIYFLQLPLPMIVGLFLFFRQRLHLLQHYLLALALLSFMGYATYLLFPAMPPWLASYYGFLPPVERILFNVYNAMGLTFINGFYGDFNHHPVAAVPSMHMSLTLLPMIYLILGSRMAVKIAAVALTFFMLFIIVYLGEHYVFDALIGMLYAVLSYYLSELVFLFIEHQALRPKPGIRAGEPHAI